MLNYISEKIIQTRKELETAEPGEKLFYNGKLSALIEMELYLRNLMEVMRMGSEKDGDIR